MIINYKYFLLIFVLILSGCWEGKKSKYQIQCVEILGLQKNTLEYKECSENKFNFHVYNIDNFYSEKLIEIQNFNSLVDELNKQKFLISKDEFVKVDISQYQKNNKLGKFYFDEELKPINEKIYFQHQDYDFVTEYGEIEPEDAGLDLPPIRLYGDYTPDEGFGYRFGATFDNFDIEQKYRNNYDLFWEFFIIFMDFDTNYIDYELPFHLYGEFKIKKSEISEEYIFTIQEFTFDQINISEDKLKKILLSYYLRWFDEEIEKQKYIDLVKKVTGYSII